MKITALQEYGIRCLLQLASGGSQSPQTTTSVASREGLSRDYVEKILFQLRKAGVVKSVRGINGGYILARKPDEISMGEVIMALSEKPVRMGRVKDDLCKQYPGNKSKCVHLNSCAIRMVWSVVMVQVFGVLNKMPLSFLLGNEEEVQKRLMSLLPKNQSEKDIKEEVPA